MSLAYKMRRRNADAARLRRAPSAFVSQRFSEAEFAMYFEANIYSRIVPSAPNPKRPTFEHERNKLLAILKLLQLPAHFIIGLEDVDPEEVSDMLVRLRMEDMGIEARERAPAFSNKVARASQISNKTARAS
jgi:hypothetical protein